MACSEIGCGVYLPGSPFTPVLSSGMGVVDLLPQGEPLHPHLWLWGEEMCLSAVLLTQGEPPDPQTQLWRWGNTFL